MRTSSLASGSSTNGALITSTVFAAHFDALEKNELGFDVDSSLED